MTFKHKLKMKQISILGCGWLGFPLALSLQRKGYIIKGSTTSKEKIPLLKKEKIDPFIISLTENSVVGDFDSFLHASETLLVNVPPAMRDQNASPFSKKIEALIPWVEKSSITQLLFVSSTSVFNEFQGEVDEATVPKPESDSGKELLKAEQLLMASKNFNTTILRFGGLFGPDRHPVNYLAGRNDLPNGNAPVNLIHLEDCIGILLAVLEADYWGKIIHGVHPEHPKKSDYYLKKAIEKNLTPPTFKTENISSNKLVLSNLISTDLGYTFQNHL